MATHDHLETRRSLLAGWYLDVLYRHRRVLNSERCHHVVRAAGRSCLVTSEQLLSALDASYRELHLALARKDSWGCDGEGRPSMLAVIGLAQRRLQARLVDEVRRGQRMPQVAAFPLASALPSETTRLFGSAEDRPDRVGDGVLAELSRESVQTRKAVLLAMAGFTAPEIGSRLGIAPSAVRQRVSRFGRRIRALEEAA